MISRIKSIITTIAVYLAVVGCVTFACFILEEATQVTIFGTWPAKSAQNWELVLEGCDLVQSINTTLKVINYGIGWIQPLAFLSYKCYATGTDYYVKALKSQAFANAPEVFIGRNVRFTFTPRTIQSEKDYVRLINRRIHVIADTVPETESIVVSGVLKQDGKLFIIDIRK